MEEREGRGGNGEGVWREGRECGGKGGEGKECGRYTTVVVVGYGRSLQSV